MKGQKSKVIKQALNFTGYVTVAILVIITTFGLAVNSVSQGGTTMGLTVKLVSVICGATVAIKMIDAVVFLCTYKHIKGDKYDKI